MMKRKTLISLRCVRHFAGALAVFLPAILLADNDQPTTIAAANCGAKIESVGAEAKASARIVHNDTLCCLLPEGDTTFVISFAKAAMLDRFIFQNENASAHGELKIAVANDNLPATSPAWTPVDGAIAFSHKRLFNLSMLGIDARYLRLSFRVDKNPQLSAVDSSRQLPSPQLAAR